MDRVKYYLYYLDSHFTGFPLIIRIVVLIVTFLILFYIFSVIRFFFIVRKQRKKNELYKKMSDRFEEKLKSILFARQSYSKDVITSKLEIDHQGSLKKNKEKETLTDLLLFVKKNGGDDDQTLNELNYSEVVDIFGLIAYWEGHLRKNNLKKNKQALRELEELTKGIPHKGNIVVHKAQSQNSDLRKHTKHSHMQHASYDAFKFLEDDFDKEFNSLDEMRMRAALDERAKKAPLPLLIRWAYTAHNEAYKCFLIKEIGFYDQKESGPQLVEMYQSEKSSYNVKEQIARTLGVLKYDDAVDVLINSYGLNPVSVQLSVIEALGNLDLPKSLSFLVKIYEQTQDGALLIKIVESIYKLDKDKSVFNNLKQKSTNDDFQSSIFSYVEKKDEIALIKLK